MLEISKKRLSAILIICLFPRFEQFAFCVRGLKKHIQRNQKATTVFLAHVHRTKLSNRWEDTNLLAESLFKKLRHFSISKSVRGEHVKENVSRYKTGVEAVSAATTPVCFQQFIGFSSPLSTRKPPCTNARSSSSPGYTVNGAIHSVLSLILSITIWL